MSLEVEYHPLAAAEIADAEDWYEHQNEGLGDRVENNEIVCVNEICPSLVRRELLGP